MALQVGIHVAVLGEALTREAFERARQAGVDCVEFWVGERGLNPDQPAQIKRIRDDLRAAGLCISAVHADFDPKLDFGSPYPEARRAGIAAALLAARLAAEAGGSMVILHPGAGHVQDEERAQRLRAGRESLEQVLEQSAPLPVRFAVENMLPGRIGDCAADLTALLKSLPEGRVGFCYDTGHARLCAEGLEVGRCMGGRMIAIHLQDNLGESDDHLMPFDGTLDWALVARLLDEAGYDGPYMLETAKPTPEAVVQRASETVRRLRALRGGAL